MRITEDTTTYTAGTVITDTDEVRTTSLGQVSTSPRSTYQVREMFFKTTGSTQAHLVGPRGSVYYLHAYGNSGAYRAVSLNTGQVLTRKGNEVLFIRLGDIIEPTTRAALAASK